MEFLEMPPKGAALGELLFTDLARERLLAGVPAHVVLQVTRLPKRGSTPLMPTLIELVDPVGSGVNKVNLAVLQACICLSP